MILIQRFVENLDDRAKFCWNDFVQSFDEKNGLKSETFFKRLK